MNLARKLAAMRQQIRDSRNALIDIENLLTAIERNRGVDPELATKLDDEGAHLHILTTNLALACADGSVDFPTVVAGVAYGGEQD